MIGTSSILKQIKESLISLNIEDTTTLVRKALDSGISAYEIVMEGLANGMNVVGDKYERGEFFLTELVVAGEALKEAMKVLDPHLKVSAIKHEGKAVIGTVKGDIHDIGKNIAVNLLRSAGFEVIDLGTDVSAEKFVNTIKNFKPDIVGMSALLTTTLANMEEIIKAIEKEGLRDKVKIIIGGAPVNDEFAIKIGADAAANDALNGVEICKKWIKFKK